MTKASNDNTIFDDVFRTMTEKMSPLLIPLINEVFGTSYQKNIPIYHNPDTHMTPNGKRITDSCFEIEHWQYHFECQSYPDKKIVIRIFEYDAAIAITKAQEEDSTLHIRFPRSAVLYLRHTQNMNATESVTLTFADGTTHIFSVPVIKAQNYSLDEIFEKNFYILLPFYLLQYEKKLNGIDTNTKVQKQLLEDYQQIHDWLTTRLGTSSNITYVDLNKLIMRIVNYLLSKEQKTRKKVGDIMGGKVLELYSEKMERLTKEACERASKKGLEQGLQQGLQQGLGQGESRLASLLKKLKADNRLSDLDLVLDNTEYREQLYKEYQL